MKHIPDVCVCGCFRCDSRWISGDKAVGRCEEPPVGDDGGATRVSVGQEVKADLPGPLPQLGVLPSHDPVQLIRPGATIWHVTENIKREDAALNV